MNSLVAHLSEATDHLHTLGSLGDPYAYVPEAVHVPADTQDASLEPYRALDASRLKLSGTGRWDPLSFLPPELAMAHAEPKSLLIHRVPDPSEYPRPDWECPTETSSWQ